MLFSESSVSLARGHEARKRVHLLLCLLLDSLLCAGCAVWPMCLSHSCAVCMVLQITTGIHSINAAGMQSVQYIHQDFLDFCIPCNTSVRVFLPFCCFLACVFNGGAFTLVIYSTNAALASNVLSALSFDFLLSHCLMVRLPL